MIASSLPSGPSAPEPQPKPKYFLTCEKPTISLMGGPGKLRLLCAADIFFNKHVAKEERELPLDENKKDMLDYLKDALDRRIANDINLPEAVTAKVVRIGGKGLSVQLTGPTAGELREIAGYDTEKGSEWEPAPGKITIPQIIAEEARVLKQAKDLGLVVRDAEEIRAEVPTSIRR